MVDVRLLRSILGARARDNANSAQIGGSERCQFRHCASYTLHAATKRRVPTMLRQGLLKGRQASRLKMPRRPTREIYLSKSAVSVRMRERYGCDSIDYALQRYMSRRNVCHVDLCAWGIVSEHHELARNAIYYGDIFPLKRR